jgi:hypothetical protein
MITEHESVCDYIYLDVIGAPSWEVSGWLSSVEYMAQGEMGGLVKRRYLEYFNLL